MVIHRSTKFMEMCMATVNIFNRDEIKHFFLSPKFWKCNCGEAKYTYAARCEHTHVDRRTLADGGIPAHGTIMCQCGHELTRGEFVSFNDVYLATLSEELSLDSAIEARAKKNDEAKLRIDLLFDMPRALEAIADLMQRALVDYEEGSWVDVPNAVKRYRAAHLRHTIRRAINPIDPQFGLDHDVAIALNAMFVLELRLREEEKSNVQKHP